MTNQQAPTVARLPNIPAELVKAIMKFIKQEHIQAKFFHVRTHFMLILEIRDPLTTKEVRTSNVMFLSHVSSLMWNNIQKRLSTLLQQSHSPETPLSFAGVEIAGETLYLHTSIEDTIPDDSIGFIIHFKRVKIEPI